MLLHLGNVTIIYYRPILKLQCNNKILQGSSCGFPSVCSFDSHQAASAARVGVRSLVIAEHSESCFRVRAKYHNNTNSPIKEPVASAQLAKHIFGMGYI